MHFIKPQSIKSRLITATGTSLTLSVSSSLLLFSSQPAFSQTNTSSLQVLQEPTQNQSPLNRGIAPTDAVGYYNLGVLLAKQNRTEEAIAAYREASRLNPFHADTYYNLGILLREQNQLNEAEVIFRRVLVIDPDYAEAYYYLGLSLAERGQLTSSEAILRTAIARIPNSADLYYSLAIVLEKQGRSIDSAVAYAEAQRLSL